MERSPRANRVELDKLQMNSTVREPNKDSESLRTSGLNELKIFHMSKCQNVIFIAIASY